MEGGRAGCGCVLFLRVGCQEVCSEQEVAAALAGVERRCPWYGFERVFCMCCFLAEDCSRAHTFVS